VFLLRAPAAEARSHFLARARVAPITYREVGATLTGLPAGSTHDHVTVHVGDGDSVFAHACEGLRRWAPATAAGIRVVPGDAAIVEGTTVPRVVHVGPAYALAACRIVAVVDEPDRFGFAYGTLPDRKSVV
jgi:uncharacterized protein (UPF0548 family)